MTDKEPVLHLVLDDQQVRHDGFKVMLRNVADKVHHAYTAPQAIALLNKHRFERAWLDHDLADVGVEHEGTGHDVAKHIVSMPAEKRPKSVFIHSWNESGAKNMEAELRAAGVLAKRLPYRAP